MKEVQSFSNNLKMEIKMERLSRVTEVSMDMRLENTAKPQAGHARGTANVNVRGTQLASEMEIYQVIEDGAYVTYSGIDGVWNREAFGTEQTSGTVLGENWFHDMGTEMDSFRVADETVEVAGQECYEMYGDVTGEYLMGFLGKDMLHAYGLVELPEDASIGKLVIPVIFDIYKEDVLPARMIVDMTDVMNALYDEYGESTNVNDFTVELGFESYNSVEEITVPPEVCAASASAGGE